MSTILYFSSRRILTCFESSVANVFNSHHFFRFMIYEFMKLIRSKINSMLAFNLFSTYKINNVVRFNSNIAQWWQPSGGCCPFSLVLYSPTGTRNHQSPAILRTSKMSFEKLSLVGSCTFCPRPSVSGQLASAGTKRLM